MYNVPGVTTLKLNAAVACGIFTGEITSWSDPAIAAINPGLTLPDQPIIPVYAATTPVQPGCSKTGASPRRRRSGRVL